MSRWTTPREPHEPTLIELTDSGYSPTKTIWYLLIKPWLWPIVRMVGRLGRLPELVMRFCGYRSLP